MLRALVALLLLANLLFFTWSQGWLSPAVAPPLHSEREPERLQQQLQPETVLVVGTGPGRATSSNGAADTAAAAGIACVEAGPFTDADAGAAEAALAAAGVAAGAWVRRDRAEPARWLVYIGRFADANALRAMEAELVQMNLAFERLGFPPELAPGLVLSQHDTAAAAEAALADALQRGARTARVVARPPGVQRWLRLAGADATLRQTLAGVSLPAGAAGFAPCAAAP
jgi:hypothetical protein